MTPQPCGSLAFPPWGYPNGSVRVFTGPNEARLVREHDRLDPVGQVQLAQDVQADTFLPIAGGFAVFSLAAGIAVLKTEAMSPKLGWLSVVAGALWLTPGEFVAIFLSVTFVAISSVVLYRRS